MTAIRLQFTICLGLLLAWLALAAHGDAETVQRGSLRVAFFGSLKPKRLPRAGAVPISVRLGGRIFTTDGGDPPGLRSIEIAINRRGRLDPGALPACELDQIQPATTANARRICGGARIGEGSFRAAVQIPGQAPYPSVGAITAFNGVEAGQPVVFLHIYGAKPAPTSLTLALRIGRGRGDFGTVLRGYLPDVDVDVGFVTGVALRIEGPRGRGGREYLSAGCPAPKGFSGAVFPLARASFAFTDGPILRSTLVRGCRARG